MISKDTMVNFLGLLNNYIYCLDHIIDRGLLAYVLDYNYV